ncbi:hypothetical protein A6M21_15760 [Desulfotomaculum copahuensis]|uniref:Uncharacterized protein n=1 Tax=Desulfotomaculum copahuensis TaxID=1838280 RepID=A0A1B7LB01_9FIRM|nr:hypothetical protein A6M21_15760 [Desulfotomaculum copahuensis]
MVFFRILFFLYSPLFPWFLFRSPNKVAITKKGASFLVPAYIITGSLFGIHSEKRFQLGMSQQAVHKVKERALNRLRKRFVLDEPTGK